MNVNELSTRKVELERTIIACDMWNTSGKSVEEIAKVVGQKIDAQKELYEVENNIKNYIEGKN